MLAHHAPDVSAQDLEPIATALAGTISGADVARMTREAKRAARREKRPITGQYVTAAALPAETRSREIVWRTAIHEAGHVIAFLVGGHVPDALSRVSGGGISGHMRARGLRRRDRAGIDERDRVDPPAIVDRRDVARPGRPERSHGRAGDCDLRPDRDDRDRRAGPPMTIFYTADNHFGHAKILGMRAAVPRRSTHERRTDPSLE
ncbi:hypothetical protein [Jiella pelagia]|uniref:Peptidase M41 domain-containing protein n=1 Tax=Jiella pelagia TaxID=2986949 RepID=A0ABY7BZK4_9HYPH|nr:hypothetical protein [Jiella pelagia]WAP68951.1 hypothetical protein OH818_27740 [Jiella pelagia]